MEDLFPNLAGSGYEITGEPSREYNCIAWALGIFTQKWDCNDPDGYWPPSVPRNEQIRTIMRLFVNEGYSVCDGEGLEQGYEKIALYSFVGQFTHVARQRDDGRWTSKLGIREVITHPSPANLSGSMYGNMHCIMRRQFPTLEPGTDQYMSHPEFWVADVSLGG